jgi:hypothetical protein
VELNSPGLHHFCPGALLTLGPEMTRDIELSIISEAENILQADFTVQPHVFVDLAHFDFARGA